MDLKDSTLPNAEAIEVQHEEVHQHEQTIWEAIKEAPGSLLWCVYALFTCIMTGYDALAAGIVLSLRQFRKDYGHPYGGDYVVPADWQLGFTAMSLFGLILGGFVSGYLVNKVGRQVCLGISYLIIIAGVFMQWYSPGKLGLFLAGKFVTGVPQGVFTAIAPAYCGEMVPLALRGTTTAAINFSLVLGQLIAYGVLRQTSSMEGALSYRIMYAVQWGFVAVCIVFLPFFKESPYLLVTKGEIDKARETLRKLHRKGLNVEERLAGIQAALTENSLKQSEQGGFRKCFGKANRFRTVICCSTFFIQAMSGVSWVNSYIGYYLALGGMNAKAVFDTSVGVMGIMLVGNIAGWFLVDILGRRGSYVWGSCILTVSLFLIGILATVNVSGAIWAQVAFMCVWAFTYQATLGAAAWPIISEVPTSALRSSTTSLCVITNGFANACWALALPYAVNPDEGNLGGKVGFLFGSVLFLCSIFIWFYYPETKGRTFLEIEHLFQNNVKPRKFHSTNLNAHRALAMDGTSA